MPFQSGEKQRGGTREAATATAAASCATRAHPHIKHILNHAYHQTHTPHGACPPPLGMGSFSHLALAPCPCAFPLSDVVGLEKSNEFFRLLYDVRGRFAVHRIGAEEAKYKLCRVKQLEMGKKKVPYIVTHDGRTIRYPDPLVAVNDTVKVDIETNKCIDHIKFETGNLAMISGGKNTGRVGVIVSRERHQGSFDIVHVKDSAGHIFATRLGNVFVIGEGTTPAVSLPKRKGIKQTILEERALRPPKGA